MQKTKNNIGNLILEYLEESPKSFKELKETKDPYLQSDATLSRYLNRLQKDELIEKQEPPKKEKGIRFRYILTKKYYEIVELNSKRTKLEDWVSSKIESQSIFNFVKHFLEDEYPNLTTSINLNELLLDIYSYIKYFNLSFKKITNNPEYYIYTIIYLVLHHPDRKYKKFQNMIDIDRGKFSDLLLEFKSKGSLEEFQFKTPNTVKRKSFLIAEDPILHNFKEQIETYFQKFLICWEFPELKFDENFDILYHFSHFILNNEYKKYDQDRKQLVNFFKDFEICLLIFIREYLWEFLEKLELESELEPPFKLLDYNQKKKALFKILLSPRPLPSNEKRNIESYFNNLKSDGDGSIAFIETIITELLSKIKEIVEDEKRNEEKSIVFYESHLQFLLRIYQNLDIRSYKMFKQNNVIITKSTEIKLSYTALSEVILKEIIRLQIGFGEKFDYERRSFTIRFLLERIDHIINSFTLGGLGESIAIQKIKDIIKNVKSHFSEKIQKVFIKKIQNVKSEELKIEFESPFLEDEKDFEEPVLKEKVKDNEVFPFNFVFPRTRLKVENWDIISSTYANDPVKLIQKIDQLLFTKFNLKNLEKLDDFALFLLKYYGIEWTNRYLDLIINYLKWFVRRKEIIAELNELRDRQITIKILDLLRSIIKAIVYWEYRERGDTIKHVKEANRIYEEIKDANYELINNFKLKLIQLQKKIL